jgi:hypothetical protein
VFDYDERISEGIVVEHDSFPGWRFTVDLALATGIVRLELRSAGEPITKRGVLRNLPLDAIAETARARAIEDLETHEAPGISMSPALASEFKELTKEYRQAPRPGRAGRDPKFYVTFAKAYLDAIEHGESVSTFAGRQHLSRSQVNTILREARIRGLYRSLGRGRSGGELTDDGKELLQEG